MSRPERLDLVTLMSRIETTHGRLVPPDGPYVLIADIYEAFGEGATYASIRDAVLSHVDAGHATQATRVGNDRPLAPSGEMAAARQHEPCPIRSSITDQPCLEPAGHPQWSEERFHHYSVSGLTEPRRRHDPSDHDCRGGAPGDRFPF